MEGDAAQSFVLRCPACGSTMGSPDAQGVALCPSCGTKVALPSTDTVREQRNLNRYKQLCDVAKQAQNWQDVLKYANQILEIEPINLEAWIEKARATSLMSTGANDRFGEALNYLAEANKLAPGDERVVAASAELRETQFRWYTYLAQKDNEAFQNMMAVCDPLSWKGPAAEWTVKEVQHYLNALRLKPDDYATMQAIENRAVWASRYIGLPWPPEILQVVSRAQQLRAQQQEAQRLKRNQQQSAQKLIQLREKLRQRQVELAKLRQKKGFLAKWDVQDVQGEINKLVAEIRRLQNAA